MLLNVHMNRYPSLLIALSRRMITASRRVNRNPMPPAYFALARLSCVAAGATFPASAKMAACPPEKMCQRCSAVSSSELWS